MNKKVTKEQVSASDTQLPVFNKAAALKSTESNIFLLKKLLKRIIPDLEDLFSDLEKLIEKQGIEEAEEVLLEFQELLSEIYAERLLAHLNKIRIQLENQTIDEQDFNNSLATELAVLCNTLNKELA